MTSEAIISRDFHCLFFSFSIISANSGSTASRGSLPGYASGLTCGVDPYLHFVTSSLIQRFDALSKGGNSITTVSTSYNKYNKQHNDY